MFMMRHMIFHLTPNMYSLLNVMMFMAFMSHNYWAFSTRLKYHNLVMRRDFALYLYFVRNSRDSSPYFPIKG